MQDLKNEGENNSSKQNWLEQHPFDQQLRRLMVDAEVAPDRELMDKMFAELATTDMPSQADKEAGYEAPVREMKTQIKGTRRPLLTYAAAIAGILIVLSIGIKELNNKDAVIQAPAGLTAMDNTGNSDPKTQGDLTQGSNLNRDTDTDTETDTHSNTTNNIAAITTQPAAKKTVGAQPITNANDPSATGQSSGAVAKLPAVVKTRQVVVNKENVKTKSGAIAKTIGDATVHQSQPAAQLALAKKQNTTTNSRTAAAATTTTTDQSNAAQYKRQAGLTTGQVVKIDKRPLKSAEEVAKVALINEADMAAVRNMEQNPPVTSSSIQVDKVNAPTYHQTALVEEVKDSDARGNHRKGGGFFRGLVQKIGNSARAISEEVVTQDEDKTVINVGIVAITTYR